MKFEWDVLLQKTRRSKVLFYLLREMATLTGFEPVLPGRKPDVLSPLDDRVLFIEWRYICGAAGHPRSACAMADTALTCPHTLHKKS